MEGRPLQNVHDECFAENFILNFLLWRLVPNVVVAVIENKLS